MNSEAITESEDWIVEFWRHVWVLPHNPDADPYDANPVIGYSYQDFFKGDLKFSCLRPSDSEVIEKELAKGQRFTPRLLLHFTDHHRDLFESLLGDGLLQQSKDDRHHLVDIALLQAEAGNFKIAFLICRHLMRAGWLKETIESKSRHSKTVPKAYAKEFFEELSAIIDSASHVVCHERLEKELSTKDKNVQKKKL